MSDSVGITLGDTYPIAAQTQAPDGSAINADALPVWEVRATADNSLLFTGSMSLTSGKTGDYYANIAMTAANGVSAGGSYRIYVTVTVSGRTPPAIEKALLAVASVAASPSLTRVSGVGLTAKERLLNRINFNLALLAEMDTASSSIITAGNIIEFNIAGKMVKYNSTSAMEKDRIYRERQLEDDTSRYNALNR